MKKTIKKYSRGLMYVICLTFMLTACNNDEFLEEKPRDAIFSEGLLVNRTGFMFSLNALNKKVTKERTGNVINGLVESGLFFKVGTDNIIGNNATSTVIHPSWYFRGYNPNRGDIRNAFNWLYEVVNTANFIIDNAESDGIDWEGSTPEESEANKNYVIAHAKLVWTWAYRNLTYLWGPVPISTAQIDGTTIRNDWTRDSVESVREVMEEYLLFAEEHLLDDSTDPTLLTKVIPRHYLAELYLAMNDAQSAEAKALLVVNDSKYALITSRYGVKQNEPGVAFMDQFYAGNVLRSQGNTEVLWAFITKEDVVGAPEFNMRRTWVTRYDRDPAGIPITEEYGGRGLAGLAISAYGFEVYDDPNDDRFSEFAIRKSWVATSGEIVIAEMSRDDEPTFSARNNTRWAHTRKWDGVSSDPNQLAGSITYTDQPYLRLAETYLLLAEAQMKLNNTTGAAEWINKIRRRANTYEITGADVDMEFILDERSRELLTEEHRRHTLSRVGLLHERVIKYNKGAELNMQPYHVLAPIPQSVIDANSDAIMEQNPGYGI